MGLAINVIHAEEKLISLSDLLKRGSEDKIFQQYDNENPRNVFYINCGLNEERVVCIWYEDESEIYRLSTEDKKGLAQFYPHVKVKDVTNSVDIKITVTLNAG